MALGRLVGMVVGVKMVGVREVGVVRSLFVRARFVVPCCFLVMTGSVFEVFGSFRVMLRRFLGHSSSVERIGSLMVPKGPSAVSSASGNDYPRLVGTDDGGRSLRYDRPTLSRSTALSIVRTLFAPNVHGSGAASVDRRDNTGICP